MGSETFRYGNDGCMMALAVPLAYCPAGSYPVARTQMEQNEGSGFPVTGTSGRETEVLTPEILLATTVEESVRTSARRCGDEVGYLG